MLAELERFKTNSVKDKQTSFVQQDELEERLVLLSNELSDAQETIKKLNSELQSYEEMHQVWAYCSWCFNY